MPRLLTGLLKANDVVLPKRSPCRIGAAGIPREQNEGSLPFVGDTDSETGRVGVHDLVPSPRLRRSQGLKRAVSEALSRHVETLGNGRATESMELPCCAMR